MFRVSLFKRERTNDATRDPYAHKRTTPGVRLHRAGGPSRRVMFCSGGARPTGARGFRVETAPLAILVMIEDIVTCRDPASDSSFVPTSSLENVDVNVLYAALSTCISS